MNFGYARCSKWDVDYSMESDPARRLRAVFNKENELNKFLARQDIVIHSMRIFYRYV